MMQDPYDNKHEDDESTLESKESLGGGELDDSNHYALPRMVTAGDELESLCRAEMSGGNDSSVFGFPPTCLPIVRMLAGNHCCVDCGDEDQSRLTYASIGYGTILCQECAARHVSMSDQESNIKSLKNEDWNLHSTLTLLEGGNTAMLDFVKHKPRWRPPKGRAGEFSEDVLAFKQIYLSRASGTYRKNLAKNVDDTFYSRITTMREEDAAKEKELYMKSLSPPDPFQHILEKSNMSQEDFPDLFDSTKSSRNDANNGGGTGDGAKKVAKKKTSGLGKKGKSAMSTPLMKRETPSIDHIKERINMRRGMNASIVEKRPSETLDTSQGSGSRTNMSNPMSTEEALFGVAGLIKPSQQQQPGAIVHGSAAKYQPKSNRRRRGSEDLVGEVGGSFVQKLDDGTVTSMADGASHQKLAMKQDLSDYSGFDESFVSRDQTMVSHVSRSQANAPQMGRYTTTRRGSRGPSPSRRRSSDGNGSGQMVPAQRPYYKAQAAALRRRSIASADTAGAPPGAGQMVPRRRFVDQSADPVAARRGTSSRNLMDTAGGQGMSSRNLPARPGGGQLVLPQRPMLRELS